MRDKRFQRRFRDPRRSGSVDDLSPPVTPITGPHHDNAADLSLMYLDLE